MLGTGAERQVYLPDPLAQADVLIDTGMGLTAGKEEYVLSRSGNDLVVTLGSLQQTFTEGELPRATLQLGEGGAAGGDTVTIDFTNGNPLYFTELTVRGTSDAGNIVRVIGGPGVDTIDHVGTTLIANGRTIVLDQTIKVHIDGAGGNDNLSSSSLQPTVVAGGAGNDTINLPNGKALFPETLNGGEGIDTVIGVSAPDRFDQAVEYFRTTSGGEIRVNRYDVDALPLFNVVQQQSSGHTAFNVREALFGVVVDSFGTMRYGDDELVVNSVMSLAVNGENKNESFVIEANVNVTVNGAGGDDWIEITAPNATTRGGDGDDTIITGNVGNYYSETGDGDDTVQGGNGADHIVMGTWLNGGEVTHGAKAIHAGGGNDIVDTLLDQSQTDDVINGGDGFDTIIVWLGSNRAIVGDWESIEDVEEA
jgi:hypothetical protein